MFHNGTAAASLERYFIDRFITLIRESANSPECITCSVEGARKRRYEQGMRKRRRKKPARIKIYYPLGTPTSFIDIFNREKYTRMFEWVGFEARPSLSVSFKNRIWRTVVEGVQKKIFSSPVGHKASGWPPTRPPKKGNASVFVALTHIRGKNYPQSNAPRAVQGGERIADMKKGGRAVIGKKVEKFLSFALNDSIVRVYDNESSFQIGRFICTFFSTTLAFSIRYYFFSAHTYSCYQFCGTVRFVIFSSLQFHRTYTYARFVLKSSYRI